MNFEPSPNHGTDAQEKDLELVDGYLLRFRHRAILPHFGSFISPEKNRSPLATDGLGDAEMLGRKLPNEVLRQQLLEMLLAMIVEAESSDLG